MKPPTTITKPSPTILVGIIIFIVVYAPLATIWTINQLTNWQLKYTIWTWLAAHWLHLLIYFCRSNTTTTTTTYIATTPTPPTPKNES